MDLHLYMSALITPGFIISYSRLASSSVAFHSAPLRVEPPGIPSPPFPARRHLPEGSPHMLSFSFPNRLVEPAPYRSSLYAIWLLFSRLFKDKILFGCFMNYYIVAHFPAFSTIRGLLYVSNISLNLYRSISSKLAISSGSIPLKSR